MIRMMLYGEWCQRVSLPCLDCSYTFSVRIARKFKPLISVVTLQARLSFCRVSI